MLTTHETFEQFALADPERRWEMHEGRLREKPPMTFTHNRVAILLGAQLLPQVDLRHVDVRINAGQVRRPDVTYYIPDLFVVPLERSLRQSADGDPLEVYDDPVLLVVEIWSPSTGDYDIDAKLPAYRARGDLEIWRLHPYDRTLRVWHRQADGSYAEALHQGGTIQPIGLPGVTIDLDALFA